MERAKPHIVPKFVIWTFFAVGLISALAFRIIIVIERIDPRWVRPVWYVAVGGYFFFFLYRYRISKKRKNAIRDYQLIEKVKANACLGDEEREVLTYLLTSVKVSLEDLNYAIIFVLSIVVIFVDIVMTALK